jgi:DNA-binding SARP family transcriptional activator
MATRPETREPLGSADRATQVMDIRVLGPLTLRIGAAEVTPRARKPRQLLALLLLNANRFVSTPYLLRGLWGDTLPHSAMTTLQTYVLQLRNKLSENGAFPAKDILITMDGGYLFAVPDPQFDLHLYQRLVRDGIAALKARDDHRAKRLLDSALDLWTGEPLADVRHGQILEDEAVRLEESRLRTLEHRIDAELRLGGYWEVLEELSSLTTRHPLHENFHLQYMLALYRSDHRPEALRVFRKLRRTLVQELGIEPTPRVQLLHHAILTSDPCLDSPGDPSATLTGGSPTSAFPT